MSGTLRLRGATSGYSELQAPAVAADQTFILPTAGGTLLTTDSPVPKLTLELGSASQPSLTFEGDTDTGLYSSGTNTLNLVTGGNNRLNIDSSGRVGLNTTSPTKTLDVNGTFRVVNESVFDADVIVYGDAQLNQQGLKFQSGLITAVQANGGNSVFRGLTTAGGNYNIDLKASGEASFLGNVGIGTTSPAHNLDISPASGAAELKIAGAEGQEASIRLYADQGDDAADIKKLLTDTSGNFKIQHYLGSAFVDSMVIDSAGKVGIGCTPVRDLQLHTSDASSELMLSNSTTGATAGSGFMIQQDGNDTYIWNKENSFMSFGTNALERMRITNLGLGVGTGTITVGRPVHAHTSGGGSAYFQSTNDTTGQGSANGALFGVSGDITYAPWSYVNGPIIFAANSAERMRIDSSGNVQIGTTTSNGFKFKVSDGGASEFAFFPNDSGVNSLVNYNRSSSAYVDMSISAKEFIIKAGTSAAEYLRIVSSGRVGIGTNDPSTKLDVRGEISVAFDANYGIRFYNQDRTNWSSIGNHVATGSTAANLIFKDSTGESMRISGGNVGIGASALASSSRLTLFEDTGNAQTLEIIAARASGVGSQPGIKFTNNSTGNLGGIYGEVSSASVNLQTGGTVRMRIGSTGQVMINRTTVNNGGRLSLNFPGSTENGIVLQTTYTGLQSNFMIFRNSSNNLCGQILQNGTTSVQYLSGSDYRLKENVVNIVDGIARVKQLSPKRFNFIGDADAIVDGFIAHEAQAVVPEAVSGEKDGEEMQGIDQSKLVPLLTAALQEAIAKIETLEQRLSDAGID